MGTPKYAEREDIILVRPDEVLGGLVGAELKTWDEILALLTRYISQNDLVGTENPRAIRTDTRLRSLFGDKDELTLSEM